jgi:SET domain-containing protein
MFARVAIKKGQFIIRYRGRRIPTETTEGLDTRYLFEINNRWTIDGASRSNRARYINHACRPNAEVYIVKHAINIRAIRNIKPGDEITYNYGRNYVDAFIKPVGCKCLACARKRAKKRAEEKAKERAKERAKDRAKSRARSLRRKRAKQRKGARRSHRR